MKATVLIPIAIAVLVLIGAVAMFSRPNVSAPAPGISTTEPATPEPATPAGG
jgi:hypothetical protein